MLFSPAPAVQGDIETSKGDIETSKALTLG